MKSIQWLQGFRNLGGREAIRSWTAGGRSQNDNSAFRNLSEPEGSPSGAEAPLGRSLSRRPKSAIQRGFTLIEIIIVIVILSIVSGITIKFLIDSLKIYTMTVNQKILFDEGKLALERMCRDIRDARSITLPASGGSGNTITFQRTNPTGSGQDLADETITYRLSSGVIQREKASYSLPYPILASNVSVFTVTRGATNDEITIVLTLLLGTGENVNLQTKVYIKNLDKDATNTYKNFFRNWREEPTS